MKKKSSDLDLDLGLFLVESWLGSGSVQRLL